MNPARWHRDQLPYFFSKLTTGVPSSLLPARIYSPVPPLRSDKANNRLGRGSLSPPRHSRAREVLSQARRHIFLHGAGNWPTFFFLAAPASQAKDLLGASFSARPVTHSFWCCCTQM